MQLKRLKGVIFGRSQARNYIHVTYNISIAILTAFYLSIVYTYEKVKVFKLKVYIPIWVCLSELYIPLPSTLPETYHTQPINRLLMYKHLISFQNQNNPAPKARSATYL